MTYHMQVINMTQNYGNTFMTHNINRVSECVEFNVPLDT